MFLSEFVDTGPHCLRLPAAGQLQMASAASVMVEEGGKQITQTELRAKLEAIQRVRQLAAGKCRVGEWDAWLGKAGFRNWKECVLC